MIVVLGVIGIGIGVGTLVGLGPASILAGLTALVLALASFGGSLRADLIMLARFTPLMIIATVVPRLLAPTYPWVAIGLVVVLVFVAGLLPSRGPRYKSFGMGLGLGTVLAYGMVLNGDARPGQVVLAAFTAVAIVVVIRVAAGARDPAGPVRKQAAAVLTDVEPQGGAAYVTWLRDRPVRWVGDVITAGLAYRSARSSAWSGLPGHEPLTDDEQAALDERGEAVAAMVSERVLSPESRASGEAAEWPDGSASWTALRRAASAALERDESRVVLSSRARSTFERAAVAAPLSWRSETLRHAIRSSLGMAGVLVLAHLTMDLGDPLLPTLLSTAFSVLQISWTESLVKARQRILGVLAGAAVTLLAVELLPSNVLLPVAVVALLVAFWFLTSNPVVANACFVLMSVGLNAGSRGLDPERTLVEYTLLVLAAVAIAVFFAFAVVPAIRPTSLRERSEAALAAHAALLDALSSASDESARVGAIRILRDADRTAADLRAALRAGDEADGRGRAAADALADALQSLGALAVLTAARSQPVASDELVRGAIVLRSRSVGHRDRAATADESSGHDHGARGGVAWIAPLAELAVTRFDEAMTR